MTFVLPCCSTRRGDFPLLRGRKFETFEVLVPGSDYSPCFVPWDFRS